MYSKKTTLARSIRDFYHVRDPQMVTMLYMALQPKWDNWCREHSQDLEFVNERLTGQDALVCALPLRLVWDFLRQNLDIY